MIQTKVFQMPDQVKEANEFLATHKPQENQVSFNRDMIFVYYEDGTFPLEYERDMWGEYLFPIYQQRQDTEIAIAVLKLDLVNAKEIKAHDIVKQIEEQIASLEKQIANREFKVKFIQNKIAEIEKKIAERDAKPKTRKQGN